MSNSHKMRDVRFALRQLWRNPGFSVVIVLTLSLGIGASTAIFSVIDAVLLHPLPYRDADRLIEITKTFKRFGLVNGPASPLEYLDYRSMATNYSELVAIGSTSYTLTGSSAPESVTGMRISASVFGMLNVEPVLGNVFTPDAEQFGRNYVMVISEDLWRRRYGSDPLIIGTNVQMNQQSYRIVGVIHPLLRYRIAADVWTPLAFAPADLLPRNRGNMYLEVIGRLKVGVTIEQANAQIRGIAARLAAEYPTFYEKSSGYSLEVAPLARRVVGDLRTPLNILAIAVVVVLLISCTNVSNLLLARGIMRRKEISIRVALGAGKGCVIRQLLTESMLFALIAALVGVTIVLGGLHLLAKYGPDNLIRGSQPKVNASVLGFALALSIAASFVFGLLPSLEAARNDLSQAVKEVARGTTGGRVRRGMRELLVALEVAASLVLLIVTGLLARSFVNLERVSPGFNEKNVLTFQVALPITEYRQLSQAAAFQRTLVVRLRALPGVLDVGATDSLPLSGTQPAGSFEIAGRPRSPSDPLVGQFRATNGYFEAMMIPLLQGRHITAGDDQGTPLVAIINERFAKTFFPNEDVLGRKITNMWGQICTIVGVVGSVKQLDLAAEPTPSIYYSAYQFPSLSLSFAVKTAPAPLALVADARQELFSLDRNLPLARISTIEQRLENSLARQRLSIQLLMVLAGIGTVLAVIGIYGVVTHVVDQRRREFGIRMALGARRSDLLLLVLRQGLIPIAIGLGLGVGGALSVTRVMRSLLYQVSSTDPIMFVSISLGLAAVATAAMFLPACRASKMDPVESLRRE